MLQYGQAYQNYAVEGKSHWEHNFPIVLFDVNFLTLTMILCIALKYELYQNKHGNTVKPWAWNAGTDLSLSFITQVPNWSQL